jgi:hypothetical protein
MARRLKHFSPLISLEFAFDRVMHLKLQQAYEVLVPDRVRVIAEPLNKEGYHESRGDLRESVLRQAERREHNSESDSSATGICSKPGLRGSRRMGNRR